MLKMLWTSIDIRTKSTHQAGTSKQHKNGRKKNRPNAMVFRSCMHIAYPQGAITDWKHWFYHESTLYSSRLPINLPYILNTIHGIQNAAVQQCSMDFVAFVLPISIRYAQVMSILIKKVQAHYSIFDTNHKFIHTHTYTVNCEHIRWIRGFNIENPNSNL